MFYFVRQKIKCRICKGKVHFLAKISYFLMKYEIALTVNPSENNRLFLSITIFSFLIIYKRHFLCFFVPHSYVIFYVYFNNFNTVL